jgi:hypothetical protein
VYEVEGRLCVYQAIYPDRDRAIADIEQRRSS